MRRPMIFDDFSATAAFCLFGGVDGILCDVPDRFFVDNELLAPRLAIFSHITHSNNLLVLMVRDYDGIA